MNIQIDKLNPHLRDTFNTFVIDYFLPNEDIVWLGDITFSGTDNQHYFPFGFLAITSKRIFIPAIYPEIKGTMIFEPRRSWLMIKNNGLKPMVTPREYIIAPITSELSDYEKESIDIREYPIRNLFNVMRSDWMVSEDPKKLIHLKNDTGIITKMTLRFWPDSAPSFFFYSPEEGREVYTYLHQVIDQNANKNPI
jgi:hypothetical protein